MWTIFYSSKYPARICRLLRSENVLGELKSFFLCSSELKERSFVLRKFSEYPEFSQIVLCVVTSKNEVLIIAREFDTITFNRRYFAYEIVRSNRYYKTETKSILFFSKIWVFKQAEKTFVHRMSTLVFFVIK